MFSLPLPRRLKVQVPNKSRYVVGAKDDLSGEALSSQPDDLHDGNKPLI